MSDAIRDTGYGIRDTGEQKPPLRIISLKTENVMGVKAIELRPGQDDSLLVIGGDNGAGKSSLIDSLFWAIGGKPDVKDPIRRGEEKSSVTLDLGELKVTRKFTRKEGGYTTTLDVQNAEGAKYSSPQHLLDKLISKFAFDPFEFTRMKEKEQEELVRRVLKLDTSVIDAAYQEAYEQRTAVNREIERLKARNVGTVFDEEAGTVEVDLSALMAELKAVNDHNAKAAEAKALAATAESRLNDAVAWIMRQQQVVNDLKAQLVAAEEKLAEYSDKLPEIKDMSVMASLAAAELQAKDTADIESRISSAEELNRRVRQNLALQEARAEFGKVEAERAELEKVLLACAGEKKVKTASAVGAAKLAVAGLELRDGGLYLGDIPFSQCNTAEQLKLSVALAVKENPRLRVYRIADGEKLTPPNMEILRQIATDAGALILVEFAVTPADVAAGYREVSVLIEDGMLISSPDPLPNGSPSAGKNSDRTLSPECTREESAELAPGTSAQGAPLLEVAS